MRSTRKLRRAMLGLIAAGSVAACSLVLDFDELLPLPVAAPVDANPPIDAIEEEAAAVVCPAGFADCNGDRICETNIAQSDPNNCGACGRSCDVEGASLACTAGVCAPQIIARSEQPQGVATDNEWVYWSNNVAGADAGIIRATSDGGSRSDLVLDTDRPFWLVLDGAHLYFTTNGGQTNWVKRIPKSGGPSESLADGGRTFTNLAVANGNVFWTVRDDVRGLVNRVPVTGGPIVTLATNQQTPFGITTVGNDVYWVTQIDGRVNRADQDGGGPTFIQLAPSVAPQFITTDGQRVYWTNAGPQGGVYSSVIPFTTPATFTKLADVGAACFGIAVDGDFVYWATNTSVQRIRKDGQGPLTTLATLPSPLNGVRYVAIDAKYVYFTAGSAGLVLRTAK